MPRRKCPRFVDGVPANRWFKPAGVPLSDLDEVVLALDEVEALRLADGEGCYQEEAAEQMGISRQTIGRILAEARRKVADALVNGKAIRIDGGNVTIRQSRTFGCLGCSHQWEVPCGTPRPDVCPACGCADVRRTDGRCGGGRGRGCRGGRGGRGGGGRHGHGHDDGGGANQ